MQIAIKDQLLLYIRDKNNIGKSSVIPALKIGFIFLDRLKKLVISTPMRCTIDSIRENIIYIILGINTRFRKNFIIKANML